MLIHKVLPILAGMLLSVHANAITTAIADFTVVRNGSVWFQDTFGDGLEPPTSPAFGSCGTQCYGVSGTFPDGSEANDRLMLDSALGNEGTNAVGASVRSQRATLLLFTNPGPNQGLQAESTYSVSGLFDFVIPGAREAYSIALNDRATGHIRNDDVHIQVVNPDGNSPQVRFRRQDFENHTQTVFSALPVAPSDGDQIRLILSHPTANTNTIYASFEFLKAGVSQGVVQLAGSADIYTDEVWTRPEFRISMPVPEPEAYVLMIAGLGVVGWMARRTRRPD